MVEHVLGERREVVLLAEEGEFRPVPAHDGGTAWLHGWLAKGGRLEPTPGPAHGEPVQGRYLLVHHEPRTRSVSIRGDDFASVPLFAARSGGRLLLSTRVRRLVETGLPARRLDCDALSDLLAFNRSIGGRTLLEEISGVDTAGTTRIDLDALELHPVEGWRPERVLCEPTVAFGDVRDELVVRFREAVAASVAGHPNVAITLSGGLDTRCLLAAGLELGCSPSTWHVSVPGSRAERCARRVAATAGVPFHAFPLDRGFAGVYADLLRRVVESSDGLKFAPQVEMLWLRDQVPADSVVLHGAFGELCKLRELRDLRLDDAVVRADRRELAALLWRRYRARFEARLSIFGADLRRRLEPGARAGLERRIEEAPAHLDPPRILQIRYFEDFLRSARYGHRLWNERVPTRFPFLHPRFVDLLLRVRSEDRMDGAFQHHLLERLAPDLHRLPDENTGASAAAPGPWRGVIRWLDLLRIGLLDSKVDSGHGDLPGWLAGMTPPLEELVADARPLGLYDPDALDAAISRLRRHLRRPAPLRGPSRREAERAALALETFLLVELSRRWLGWIPA